MQTSFYRLGLGMIFAVVLVYLLMAVNFQSWLDPFIILMALPGALAGIVWILFVTQTTFSVPSLMGSIMCIGVATANSILVVVFANDQRLEGMDARAAALSAGHTRIRPVLMTAAAMIIGMMPMALGMGEGGEQNAPLGRAVIGGLVLATVTTLFIVPLVYSLLRRSRRWITIGESPRRRHEYLRRARMNCSREDSDMNADSNTEPKSRLRARDRGSEAPTGGSGNELAAPDEPRAPAAGRPALRGAGAAADRALIVAGFFAGYVPRQRRERCWRRNRRPAREACRW